jgi:cytochrome c oxidase subunit 2
VVATGSQVPARPGARSGQRPGRTVRRVAGAAAGGLLTLALLSGCSVKQAFSFGWPQGGITPQSERMFNLWVGSTVAALSVGVFVWGLIFWCVIRYRKRGDALPPQTRYNLPIELIYSVAPFLVVSVLFYYTVVVQTDVNRLGTPDVVVTVQPSKWNWTFQYPETKGADNRPVATVGSSDYIPVLVVPTNKRIEFVEHSPDVIHSFWVPALLFKRDVFPGNVVNRFQTSILTPGAYVGRCAELCGTYHSMMNFELRAVTPEQFDKFLAAKKQGLSTPEALASIGQEPFATTTAPFPTKRDADIVNN